MNQIEQQLIKDTKKIYGDNVKMVEALDSIRKEAKAALTDTGVWQQDFHEVEPVALVAVYRATREALVNKQHALGIAVDFIGTLEETNPDAIKALEGINQALVGESIQQSIDSKG